MIAGPTVGDSTITARAMTGSATICSIRVRRASDDLVRPGRGSRGEALADRLPRSSLKAASKRATKHSSLPAVVLVEGLEADVGAFDDQLDGDVGVAALGDELADGAEDAAALIGVGAGAGDGRRRCVRSGA